MTEKIVVRWLLLNHFLYLVMIGGVSLMIFMKWEEKYKKESMEVFGWTVTLVTVSMILTLVFYELSSW